MKNLTTCSFISALLLTASAVVVVASSKDVHSSSVIVETGAETTVQRPIGCANVTLIESSESLTEISYETTEFNAEEVRIDGVDYTRITLPGEVCIATKGEPDLPVIRRSIIIPNNAKVEVKLAESRYVEYNMAIAPSKGHVSRDLNRDDVPYEFSEAYSKGEFYPVDRVELGSPYILRDYRAVTVTVCPFAYNPQTKTLRHYTHMLVEVRNTGIDSENAKLRNNEKLSRYFEDIYRSRFLNYEDYRYDAVDEVGRMIVISHGEFMNAAQPYADWKRQKGIPTDLYDVADIGLTADEIQGFIQTEYDADDGLTFVQFVGDADQVPTLLINRDFCDGKATSDASYALLEGEDSYPDVFVGRFSASSVAEVETQVQRTIHYERDIAGGDWLHKGTGMGSAWGEGYGYMGMRDRELVEALRLMLLSFTYTEIDQLYEKGEPPFSIIPVEVSDFIDAINEGKGIVNIEGHADCEATFMIPPGIPGGDNFTTDSIYNLNNDYMLPFVFIGAPYLGNFQIDVAFPEAWLRATDDVTGAPIGAIAVCASSTDLDYASPQAMHHELIDLLVNSGFNTIGGLMYNGACHAIDLYGTRGEKTYKSYHVFGDVSLQIRTDTPASMAVLHESTIAAGSVSFDVIVDGVEDALCAMSRNSELLGHAFTDASGLADIQFEDPIAAGENLDLVVTAFNRVTYVAEVSVNPIACGDTDASGAVDIDDVVYLINYIFAGGPAPDPLAAGDANCVGGIDIDDVVYLINYIFAGGPAPCDPNGDEVPDC